MTRFKGDRAVADAETTRLISLATQLQQGGRIDEAARTFEVVLNRDPVHPVALNSLGMLALSRKEYASACDLFDRATTSDPKAPPLWMNLATAARGAGDVEQERRALTGALAIDQRDLMANIRLAELHERLGERGGANARWSAVLAVAQMLPERSPQLEAIVERARAHVAREAAAFGQSIDDGLADARARLAPAERRRFDASVDAMLGRRRVYVNECHGMHFAFLPADEVFDRALTPWFAELEAQTDAIRAECAALMANGLALQPYVAMDAGTPANKWSALDHKDDWSAAYLWRYGEPDVAVQAACPRTTALLAALPRNDMPKRGPTAFFSILKPGTRLPAHTGVSNARAIVHLPLIVPPGCGFRVGGETREWRVGEAFAFDDTIEHEAWNDSGEARAVLIFDIWNPHLTAVERDLLRTFFTVTDASGLNPGGSTAVVD